MAKRFTDSDKWKDDWYISLSNDYKIVWQWLLDNCSHSGLCKRSVFLLNTMCKVNLTEDEIISFGNDRIIIIDDYWFIPKFLKFQYSTLLSAKPAIISVVKDIFTYKLQDFIPKSFGNDYIIVSKSFLNHCQIIKDKDKDKVKVKEQLNEIIYNTENSNFEKNEEDMIVTEMMKVWNKHNPKSLFDIDKDYPSCLDIAYKIAQVKGWSKSDVIKFNELHVLKSWSKIMTFIKSDNFFQNWPLKNINNNFQMIVLKMSNINDSSTNNEKIIVPKVMTEQEKQKAMEDWANSD